MKHIFKLLLVACLLAGSLTNAPLSCGADTTIKAQDKAAGQPRESTTKSKPKRDWYPFGGIVVSVDKKSNTISLKKKEGERVLRLDSKSTLEINGKAAVIGNIKVGDYAHGKLHKDDARNEVITNAKFEKEKPSRNKDAVDKAPRKTPASKSRQ